MHVGVFSEFLSRTERMSRFPTIEFNYSNCFGVHSYGPGVDLQLEDPGAKLKSIPDVYMSFASNLLPTDLLL